MKIIFYSYSGVHSAVLAGAACLGRLSFQKAASLKFKEVPFFGCKETKGRIYYLGEDKIGNKVYSLGVQGELKLIPKAISNFIEIADIPKDIMMINTFSYLSTLTRWGERLAGNGFLLLGNFLACQGLKKDFPLLFKEAQKKLGDSWS